MPFPIRVTPAMEAEAVQMEAGLTGDVWTIEEMRGKVGL